MDGIARRQNRIAHSDGFGPPDSAGAYGKDVVNDSEEGVKSRLSRIPANNRHMSMQGFLKHLGVGHQSQPFGDASLEQSLRIDLVGMRSAREAGPDYACTVSSDLIMLQGIAG